MNAIQELITVNQELKLTVQSIVTCQTGDDITKIVRSIEQSKTTDLIIVKFKKDSRRYFAKINNGCLNFEWAGCKRRYWIAIEDIK